MQMLSGAKRSLWHFEDGPDAVEARKRRKMFARAGGVEQGQSGPEPQVEATVTFPGLQKNGTLLPCMVLQCSSSKYLLRRLCDDLQLGPCSS